MKRIANRGLALLMAVLMCVSLLTVAQPHAHAANDWVKNWGVRGAAATELSDSAEAFYTENNTYASLSQLSGGTSYADAPSSELYSALQALMSGKQTVVTSYDDTKEMYQYTDCQNGGGSISSFYSGVAIGPEWGSSPSWNREHTWPNSKGSGDAENDIMMLRPTASSENSSRGNTAYGESDGFYDPNGASGGNYDLRGDVARIMLYVYTRWGNIDFMWGAEGVIESQDVLLKWIHEDPVDTWELGRNDSVESITGTRNVFVDYPELAYLLFGQEIPPSLATPSNGAEPGSHTCSYGAGVVTDPTCTALGYTTYTCTDPECGYSYTAEYTALIPHSFEEGICTVCGAAEAAGTILVTDVADLQAGDRIVIVAKDYDKALSTTQNNNNRGVAAVTKTGNTVSFNDDTQIIHLEEGSKADTFAFKVDGGYLYAASSSKNYLRTEAALSDNSSWSITIGSDGVATVKAQGSNTRNWLRYNSGSGLFSVYASGQTDILIYELPGCTHSWDEATCAAPKTCSKCGATEGESLPHSWDEATCTAPKTCSVCGATEGSKLAHSYVEGVCSVCGAAAPTVKTVKIYYPDGQTYVTSTVSGSKLTAGTVDEAAVWTMTPDGDYYSFSCGGMYMTAGASGNSLTLTDSLTDCGMWELEEAANGYYLRNVGANYNGNYNQYLEYYSGFTTYGFNSSKVNIYTFQLQEVAGDCQHSWDEATCTAPKTCSLCGETEGEANGHSWDEATCTAPKTCSVCGETEGEANGHSWDEATCTAPKTCSVCGATEGEANGHSWDEATCTAPKTCALCGETEGRALGHRYVSYVSSKPSCEEEGVRTYYCDNDCGAGYTESIEATGHNEVNGTCTVCGKVFFTPVEDCDGEDCVLHGFADLKVDEWYHDGIHYGVEKGLFQGMSENSFEPDTVTTRAQFVTILWRLEGCPEVGAAADFEDVSDGQWYTKAIGWAAAEGIIGGYGNGLFGTDDEITREQMATLLYRYAAYKGVDVSAGSADDLKGFADALQVQDYAAAAMQWACAQGLINGIPSAAELQLAPDGSATRAQAATVLYRYCEKLIK